MKKLIRFVTPLVTYCKVYDGIRIAVLAEIFIGKLWNTSSTLQICEIRDALHLH